MEAILRLGSGIVALTDNQLLFITVTEQSARVARVPVASDNGLVIVRTALVISWLFAFRPGTILIIAIARYLITAVRTNLTGSSLTVPQVSNQGDRDTALFRSDRRH